MGGVGCEIAECSGGSNAIGAVASTAITFAFSESDFVVPICSRVELSTIGDWTSGSPGGTCSGSRPAYFGRATSSSAATERVASEKTGLESRPLGSSISMFDGDS
jgi:hypothetical protein